MREPARPIKIPVLPQNLKAVQLSGDELPAEDVGSREHRQVLPCYRSGEFAVYETSPGEYEVMKNGDVWGKPYKTDDLALAREVCDRWAREFEVSALPEEDQ